jgi:hypothetical protein
MFDSPSLDRPPLADHHFSEAADEAHPLPFVSMAAIDVFSVEGGFVPE